ncbi:MAG: hypothetical protein WAK20_06625 [Candidatus Acidiferrum sp.]
MTFDEIVAAVELCGYPGYEFSVKRDGRGEMFLQGGYMEPDTVTGEPSWQVTRRWFLSPSMTQSEVVQTAFKCIITSFEHRVREWFFYRGEPVFGPHFDVEALVEICRAGKFVTR